MLDVPFLPGELSNLALALVAADCGLLLVVRLLMPMTARRVIAMPVLALVAGAALSALELLTAPGTTAATLLNIASIVLLLIALGRAGFILTVDFLLQRRLARPLPLITRQIIQGLIYAGIILIALHRAGVDTTSLLTTSALLTAIIGLSLQDILGNLFAGLAIQAETPFELGDWIRFDDDEDRFGKVIEINWRATKLLTLEQVIVVVPNAVLAKAPLMNFTKPSPLSLRSVHVTAPYDEPPDRVRELLRDALKSVDGVAPSPPPTIVTDDFSERGVRYWVRFFITNFEARHTVASDVRDRLWYALQRAELEQPIPRRDVRLFEQTESERALSRARLLGKRKRAMQGIELLRCLPEQQLEQLAERVHANLYTRGELVFEQGQRGDAFYIVERGEVAVLLRHASGVTTEMTRLGPGKFFGEMSLMSADARRSATIKTTRATTLIVIARAVLQEILEQSPELADTINQALRDRAEQLDALRAEAEQLPHESFHEPQGVFLDRIREFFSLS